MGASLVTRAAMATQPQQKTIYATPREHRLVMVKKYII